MEAKERKQIATARKYVPGNTHHGKVSSKRLMAMAKKPISTGIREITKKPVLYNKTGSEAGKPVKKVPPKPAVRKAVQTAPKAIEATETVSPASKPEVQKPPAVQKPPEAPVEPFIGGHYELSPLLSKMLEAELQDVMIKIWQLLPDDPKDDAEKLVVERFRNNAGDHLINTLGLNVTKRLLNVHNSLYVKMQFSGKPIQADLMNFVRKHSVSSFKSVGMRGGTFAAKMRNFQDFDHLCTAKNLKCGRIRVTVTPCYQFMKCPSNLRTCYDGKQENKFAKYKEICANRQAESQEIAKTVEKDGNVKDGNKQNATATGTLSKPNETTNKVADKITPTKTNAPEKDAKNTEVVTPATKPATSEKQTPAVKAVTSKPNQTVTQNSAPKPTPDPIKSHSSALKVTANSTQSQNSAPKVTVTATPTQSQNSAPKVTDNPTQSQSSTPKVTDNTTKSQDSTPKVTANPTQPQSSAPKTTIKQTATPSQSTGTKAVPSKPAQKENTTAKITPTKPAGTNNQNTSTEAKPKPTNQNTKVTQAKTVTKPNSTKVQTKQAVKATSNKATGQKVPPKAKPKQISPVKKPENDFDELDDHDILALISGGIVLDECSGSEED